MATRIKILFGSNPYIYSYMDFVVYNTETGFSKLIQKRFVPGVPVITDQVKIGATLEDTIANLIANLAANNSWSVMNYSAITDGVLIDFTPAGNYAYIENTSPGDWDMSYEYYEVTAVEDLPPFELGKDISIEIIDTYDNDRALIEEFTQIQSPRLTWEGGDEIDASLMTSKLVFNMLVETAEDAKFYHLFSGDEKRYRVEVYSIKEDETKDLIWRGYLLPDLYDEPYINGSFFVQFTAVDMIGSLKGKTLKPWFYNNRFPIAQLLAYCLENTGLQQEFIVSPSLVPASPIFTWRDIHVPLYEYVEGLKYTDCYEILKDVLEANGLTLYSFRGYWFIKGISRKHEVLNENSLVFNAAGIQTGLVNVVNKLSEPMQLRDLPTISALTPWKSVTIEINQKKSSNILPEDIVVLNNEHLKSLNQPSTDVNADYYNGIYNAFRKEGDLFSYPNSVDQFDFKLAAGAPTIRGFVVVYYNEYKVNESKALNNYFEYKKQPYLLANTEYNLEINATIIINCSGQFDIEYFPTAINRFKKCFVFQLLIDGKEIVSNRPSYFDTEKYQMKFENKGFEMSDPHLGTLKYNLKTTFSTTNAGKLTIRILYPIYKNIYGYDDVFAFQMYSMSCETLKISPVNSIDKEAENIVAIRDINYTQKKTIPINFTCSTNEMIRNNFGLGYPINVGNYFYELSLDDKRNLTVNQYTKFSELLTALTGIVDLRLWNLDFSAWFEIFGYKQLRKNILLTRLDGNEESFHDVLGLRGGFVFAYIIDTSLNPKIPKNYTIYNDEVPEVAEGNFLSYMDVRYGDEDVSLRNAWKLYGFSSEDTFIKKLAAMFHYVQPEAMFSLETTYLEYVFPNELLSFRYNEQDRNFIPTRLELDLTSGKTKVKATEAKFTELTDIVYE